MPDYNLASLPDTDEVIIIKADCDWIKDILADIKAYEQTVVTGAQAHEIAALLRSLPPGEMMRCHTPPYALQFIQKGNILLSATFCWQCNNIFIEAEHGRDNATFNGGSKEAGRLLSLLQEIL